MHRDRGRTTDSCPGKREMQTFKKLPNSSPTPNPITSNQIADVTPKVYGDAFLQQVNRFDRCQSVLSHFSNVEVPSPVIHRFP